MLIVSIALLLVVGAVFVIRIGTDRGSEAEAQTIIPLHNSTDSSSFGNINPEESPILEPSNSRTPIPSRTATIEEAPTSQVSAVETTTARERDAAADAAATAEEAGTKAASTETAIDQSVAQTVAAITTRDASATRKAAAETIPTAPTSTKAAVASATRTPVTVSCPGALPTRLEIGDTARVINYQLNVRSGPGTRYSIARRLDVGRTMEILDGPVCDDGQLWYSIRSEIIRPRDGSNPYQAEGWLVEESGGEYYLEPVN